MLLKALKRFRQICKKEAELSKAMHRLAIMPIDYQAIQTIADTVSSGYEVEIKVVQKDGTTIEIKRGVPKEMNNFKSFSEQYTDYHNNGVK